MPGFRWFGAGYGAGSMVLSVSRPGAIQRAVGVLSSYGVAILPCDTIYGIVGVAPETEGRIRSIKGRGEDKPFCSFSQTSAG